VFGRFIEAVAAGRRVVIPLWHPQWLHHRYRIRELRDPKGLPGGRDQATLIVRKEAEPRIGAAALAELAELEGLHLGNTRVSELDDRLQAAAPG
jgi:glycine betaine/proline transport system substrate-binding protein